MYSQLKEKKNCDLCALLIPCNDFIHNTCNIKKKSYLGKHFLISTDQNIYRNTYMYNTIFAFSVFSPVSHFLLLETSGFVNICSFCAAGSVFSKVNGFCLTEKNYYVLKFGLS